MSTPRPCVFVIDDEEAIRRSLGLLLRTAGLNVRIFASAAEALAATDSIEPCCVLTDHYMPQMSGPELLKALQQKGIAAHFLLMSGQDDDIPAPTEFQAELIRKPFDPDHLTKLLLRLVAETKRPGC
jgi:two-component system response regulator FixJ